MIINEWRLKDTKRSLRMLIRQLDFNIGGRYDINVFSVYRREDEQNRLYEQGYSKLRYPESKHNCYPTLAVDIAPQVNGKIDWKDLTLWKDMIGECKALAELHGIECNFGADWKMRDYPHVELKESQFGK